MKTRIKHMKVLVSGEQMIWHAECTHIGQSYIPLDGVFQSLQALACQQGSDMFDITGNSLADYQSHTHKCFLIIHQENRIREKQVDQTGKKQLAHWPIKGQKLLIGQVYYHIAFLTALMLVLSNIMSHQCERINTSYASYNHINHIKPSIKLECFMA